MQALTAAARAAASAEAIAYTCGEQYSDAEAVAYATAIAHAFASAVSSADGYCYSTDRSSACAWAGGSVSAFAYAQASAFAEAWAVAGNDCSCTIEVGTVTESFQQIFLEAHSQIEADICTGARCASAACESSCGAARWPLVCVVAVPDGRAGVQRAVWPASRSCRRRMRR